jgi:hypothetical protein
MPPTYKLGPGGGATYPKGFTCLTCKAHFAVGDFWDEQHEKWDRTMKEEDDAIDA